MGHCCTALLHWVTEFIALLHCTALQSCCTPLHCCHCPALLYCTTAQLNCTVLLHIPKVNGLKEICATRIPTKTKYSSKKAGDVTWTEKCKQTSSDRSINLVPFVWSIYKIMKYIEPFFRTRNFTWTCTELWSVIIFVENVLGCCRRYWRSAPYLPVISSSSTCGPKYF